MYTYVEELLQWFLSNEINIIDLQSLAKSSLSQFILCILSDQSVAVNLLPKD